MGRIHRLRFVATPLAVRGALIGFERGAVLSPLAADLRDCALLVLAEVLNNVAEHAYGGAAGPVAVRLVTQGGSVAARVMDRGGLPPDLHAAHPCDPDTLPEGGFGLGLIRTLATDIDQHRRMGCNIMKFSLTEANAVQKV